MKTFVWGFAQYFKGLRFSLTEKRMRHSIFFFTLVNFAIFVFVIGMLVTRLDLFLKSHIEVPSIWYQYIYYYSAYFVGVILTFFVSGVIVYFLSSALLAGLFGDILCRQSFERKNIFIEKKRRSLKENIKFFLEKVLKIFLILLFVYLFFFVALVPGLGFVGVFLGVLVVVFDMMDYSFDHLGLTLKERIAFFKRNLLSISGFGVAQLLVLSVPVVNIFLLPESIVSASHLVADITKAHTKDSSERPHT